MKKIALLVAVTLMSTALLYGCADKAAAPDASPAPEKATIPTATSDIVAHNLKIDEASIDLVQAKAPAAGAKIATIKTSAGDVKLVLYPEEAPKAVENFIALAEKGYYNGLKFYQVIPTVHIATGDPDGTGNGGKSSLADGATFEDEYSLNLWHFDGAVAMENDGVPGANGSRFYIVQNGKDEFSTELATQMLDAGFPEKVVDEYLRMGGVPNYDAKDTVFGQVFEGLDIVKTIATSPRDDANKPTEDITVTSVEISTL